MRVFLISVRYSPKRTSAVGSLREITNLKPMGISSASYTDRRVGDIRARGKDIRKALVAKAQEMLGSQCAPDEKVKLVFDRDALMEVAHGRA
ncbi:hypothetical protein [Azospirillum sp. TSO5]|uniref:hypothetical protein n=1 Tax=Azospirillum sp. TSO5 TaxID=716760 RepID=UPI000D6037A1|nr:hypothetical protein [Azospirillum sp. TSO5]PWC91938.1 hypothetical protein TSO5_18305 [Azospirillum sp. TSO5]